MTPDLRALADRLEKIKGWRSYRVGDHEFGLTRKLDPDYVQAAAALRSAADQLDAQKAEIDLLHTAVCQSVGLLNCAPEVARIEEGRKVRDVLRQALADYADAYMNKPASEIERNKIAGKHQRHRSKT